MSGFFRNFPTLSFDSNYKQGYKNVNKVTDIFFRTRFKEAVKNQNVAYYLYTIREQDTPETLANKYYGDPMAYWIIMFANDIVDPYYDWCLNSKNFRNYIIEKYGSIETAKITTHHYSKIVEIRDTASGQTFTKEMEIDFDDPRTSPAETLPYDNFTDMAETYFPNIDGVFRNGQSAVVTIRKSSISVYDWEDQKNEAKRNIKLVRKEYYNDIQAELEAFQNQRSSFFRDLRGF